MALSTYIELQASIAGWLGRTDLTTVIPDLIRLVEADLEVDPAILDEVRTTLTLSTTSATLPAACKELKTIYYDETAARGQMDIVPEQELSIRKGMHQPTGRPVLASIVDDGRTLLVSPAPDQTYTVYIKYNAFILPLATNSTNWILTNHPNVYLYGALCEAESYLENDERITVWQSKYDRALSRLKEYVERRRYSANTLRQRQRRPLDR